MESYLTEEQWQIKRTARAFAEQEIGPKVMEWDEAQYFPRDIFPRLGEMGFLGVVIPEAYGGTGLGPMEFALVIEELARVDPAVSLSVAAHVGLSAKHILLAGTEEQKRKFLPGMASGEKLGAWALTEPSSGSDAAGMKTSAVRRNGSWLLNGSKNFTTHGSYADIYVVMAITDRSQGQKGISAFIVEKGTSGLIPGRKENKLGMRASDTSFLILEECCVDGSSLLGRVNGGFVDALQVLDGGRITIGALAVGLAQGAFESALRYAKERIAFGRPIAEFQAIQVKLADMATQIEAARLLTMQAASLAEQGKPTKKTAAMAKLFASEMSVRVAEEAIQIHGGYGYVKDYPAEKYWRDSKLLTIGEGTSEIQRLVIARELLKGS